jgi:hypothetical protein
MNDRRLQEKADTLFAACLQFLISREDVFLETIRTLSQELLDEGYETKFEHRRKALLVRSQFEKLSQLNAQSQEELDRLMPRSEDLEVLPNA